MTMSLRELIAEAQAQLDELSPTIPLPKLKKPLHPGQGYTKDQSVQKTGGARPKNVASKDDDGGTKAGVKHKDVSKTYRPRDHEKTKTGAKGAAKLAKNPAKSGEKPTCPGGAQPRMVFGKWRCSGGGSKGASKAKSRIGTKRQSKGKKAPVKKGALAKLVHKARAAFKGLFSR